MPDQKNKIIYSMRIMIQLVEAGFMPKGTIPNPKDVRYNCWVFELTPELQATLDRIYAEREQGS